MVSIYLLLIYGIKDSKYCLFRNLSCEEELPWNGGTTLLKHISSAKFNGLTGPVSFSESKRTNFKLDLLKLKEDIMTRVGIWTPLGGLNISDKYAFLQGT
jgi:ionotropic glutamate receptor